MTAPAPRSQPEAAALRQAQPVCCYCDNDLCCAHCGKEQPADASPPASSTAGGEVVTDEQIAISGLNKDWNRLHYALQECLECVNAAEAEGLNEVIEELRGFSEQTDRLIDLIERRLLWVRNYAEAALASPAAETAGVSRTFDTTGTTLRRSCNVFTITCDNGETANRVADQLRATPADTSASVVGDKDYERELFAAVNKVDLPDALKHIRDWRCYIDHHNRQKYADLIENQSKLIAYLFAALTPQGKADAGSEWSAAIEDFKRDVDSALGQGGAAQEASKCGEPSLWICFADNGNIRAWTRDHNRKELFRLDGLDMQPFYSPERGSDHG